jgi:hypothetical protein
MDVLDTPKPQHPPARKLTGSGLGVFVMGKGNFSFLADIPKPTAHPRCRYGANPACKKYITTVIVTIISIVSTV